MVRKREFDEEKVLAVALDLFRRQGYRAMSFSDLARETGVQRGSLYNAFGDKESLFVRVYQNYGERFITEAETALGENGTLAEKLRRFFNVGIRSMRGGTTAYGCLSTRAIMEAQEGGAAVRDALTAMLDGLTRALKQTLSQSAEFSGDAAATAELLVAMTRGIAVFDRAYDDEERLKRVAEQAVTLVCSPPAP